MSKQIKTNTENINYYSEAIKVAENKDFIDFLKWFNGGENINAIKNSGYRDFYTHIIRPLIFERTKSGSHEMTALEIGCGGGRILNAACKYFGQAIGIDIHDSFCALEKYLRTENNNFRLFKIENNHIPVENESIDLVYSFIVFQHLLKIETFKDYIIETERVLIQKGLAIIYFGRPRFFSKTRFSPNLFNYLAILADKIIYEILYLNIFKGGYFENYAAKVNHVNLMVSKLKALKMIKKSKLKIKDFGRSQYLGTQYYFIVEK